MGTTLPLVYTVRLPSTPVLFLQHECNLLPEELEGGQVGTAGPSYLCVGLWGSPISLRIACLSPTL